MKRLACLGLLFVFLLSFAAAEGGAGEFLFRGKIRWNMSESEVIGLEGADCENYETGAVKALAYADIPVSRYSGLLAYIFSSDRLVFCMYGIQDSDEETIAYMKKALNKVYGEEVFATPLEVYDIVKKMGGDVYETEFDSIPVSKWVQPDGTSIYLVQENGDLLEIMYVSPDYMAVMDENDADRVDTTGL